MIYLILTILLNVLLSVIFKIFPKYDIDTFQAIIFNYCICVVTGSIFIGQFPFKPSVISESWLPWSLLMGTGFICIFNLFAYCTKVSGITTAVIANKLSLVIPVVFAIIIYNQHAGIIKILGIVLAFPAVYFTSHVTENDGKAQSLLVPSLLFIGGGLLDTLMNYVQLNFLTTQMSQALYSIFCFATAGSIGIIIILFLLITKKTTLKWKNLIAGSCIGIPNYFSIYYFIKMLHSPFMETSASIPILNIGILVITAMAAIFIFKEKANYMRLAGLTLSVLAILFIAFGDKI